MKLMTATAELPPGFSDDAVQLLQLTAQMRSEGATADGWHDVLSACRDWFHCDGVFSQFVETAAIGPEDLEAFAGRLTHCASFGGGACRGDDLKRQRCAGVAAHLHEAASMSHQALQAAVFDQLPPIWILTRKLKVLEANRAARALVSAGTHFTLADHVLVPATHEGAHLLLAAMSRTALETLVSWVDTDGEVSMLLRPLESGQGVVASLVTEPASVVMTGLILARQFGLYPRQSELAAHLVNGNSLSDAARLMGITRNTANQHLVALLHRTGAADRKTLMVQLRLAMRV